MLSNNPRNRAKQSCSLSLKKALSVTSKRESKAEGARKLRKATLMCTVVEIAASHKECSVAIASAFQSFQARTTLPRMLQ